MKRLLVIALVLLALVVPVSATMSLNFQDQSEIGSNIVVDTGTCRYKNNISAGNSLIQCDTFGSIRTNPGEAFTYAAFTDRGSDNGACIVLRDSAFVPLYQACLLNQYNKRFEIVMAGGKAHIYRDGIEVATSGALATNPYYLYYANGYSPGDIEIDDLVVGASESKTVFGNPSSSGIHVVKDLFNPANSGLMNTTTGVIVASTNMSTTFSRSNVTPGTPMAEETVQLMSFSDGSVRQSWTLYQNDYVGQLSTSLPEAFFNTGAPYGAYTIHIPGSTYYPNIIYYTGQGATISFDRDEYSRGTTATMTYSITGGAWDPATYDYSVKVTDLYGTELSNQAINTQSGTKTYTWASDQAVATYFAWLYATPKAGGESVPIGIDSATVNAYVIISGWVNDGETQFKIPVATVRFYQGSTPDYITTAVDGNYSTTASFLTGSQIIINVTATGYRPYQKNFTPIASVNNPLNFTLVPNSPVTTGLALGGVVREGDGQGATTSIPPKPIANATVRIWNTTYGENWSVEGNRVGYYLLDQSKGATLTSGRLYEMSATRGGYTNFSIYRKVVTG